MSLVLQSLLPYPNSCQGTSPHQQGWDTKMEKLSYGGIDVSKDRLDVVVLPEGWFFSVSNDTAGWTELVARLRPLAVCASLEVYDQFELGRLLHRQVRRRGTFEDAIDVRSGLAVLV